MYRKFQESEKRLEKQLRITTMAKTMRFILIDRIVSLESGKQIKAIKSVSLAEEYLADHFPVFPVLPGVLLLQGLIESASWLVREAENFAHSMILLEQARNVKYKSFLAPGGQIEYTVEAKTIEENVSSFTGFGASDDERIVEAKFGLRHFNLADENSAMAATDAKIIEEMRQRWKLLMS
jgi:3-hydroxyacyl-[acyl-carrier-protein] dehydratase